MSYQNDEVISLSISGIIIHEFCNESFEFISNNQIKCHACKVILDFQNYLSPNQYTNESATLIFK